MRLTLCLAAVAATLVSATPALAVPATAKANAEAHGVVLQPLTLAKVYDLDFGTVVADPSVTKPGTVVIDADTGLRSSTGGVTEVTSYPGRRGEFQGQGEAGQIVLLTLTAPSVLVSTTNASDTVTVNGLTLDKDGFTRTIDSTTVFTVGVGGDFAIAGGQPSGFYKANFDLTADYQ